MTGQRDRIFQFSLEALEQRTLLSGTPLTVTEVPWNGGLQLKIIGSAGADRITLAQLVDHRGGVDDVLDRVEEVHDRMTLTTLDGWLEYISQTVSL